MPKKRFAVRLQTRSIGVYEVQAYSREQAMGLNHDLIRSGKSLTYREEVIVDDAMEITMPDEPLIS